MKYDNDHALRIWTIYENPKDYPGKFVARESRAKAGGMLHSITPLAVADSLEAVRAAVRAASPYVLTHMPRDPNDDPVIVEVWL